MNARSPEALGKGFKPHQWRTSVIERIDKRQEAV